MDRNEPSAHGGQNDKEAEGTIDTGTEAQVGTMESMVRADGSEAGWAVLTY